MPGSPRRPRAPSAAALLRLRDQVRAALAQAPALHAPLSVVESLAIAAGMLEALAHTDAEGFRHVVHERARAALARWRSWRSQART